MGRGLGQLDSAAKDESKVPTVDLDYFCSTSVGVKRRDELAFELTKEGEDRIAEARR